MEQQAAAEIPRQCQSNRKDSDEYRGMREWLLVSLPASMPLAEKATIFTQLVEQKLTLALLKRVARDELKDVGLCVGHRMILWDALQRQRQTEKLVLEEVQSGVGCLDRNQDS